MGASLLVIVVNFLLWGLADARLVVSPNAVQKWFSGGSEVEKTPAAFNLAPQFSLLSAHCIDRTVSTVLGEALGNFLPGKYLRAVFVELFRFAFGGEAIGCLFSPGLYLMGVKLIDVDTLQPTKLWPRAVACVFYRALAELKRIPEPSAGNEDFWSTFWVNMLELAAADDSATGGDEPLIRKAFQLTTGQLRRKAEAAQKRNAKWAMYQPLRKFAKIVGYLDWFLFVVRPEHPIGVLSYVFGQRPVISSDVRLFPRTPRRASARRVRPISSSALGDWKE